VISEERREITIYHEGGSYQLRDPYDLKADVIQAPLILDQYRRAWGMI